MLFFFIQFILLDPVSGRDGDPTCLLFHDRFCVCACDTTKQIFVYNIYLYHQHVALRIFVLLKETEKRTKTTNAFCLRLSDF